MSSKPENCRIVCAKLWGTRCGNKPKRHVIPNHDLAWHRKRRVARKCVFKLSFREWQGANVDGIIALGEG